jgi:hypothetical protein
VHCTRGISTSDLTVTVLGDWHTGNTAAASLAVVTIMLLDSVRRVALVVADDDDW